MAETGSTPSAIRAASRAIFYRNLPHLASIIESEAERSTDRIKAMELVGKFGLGAADQASVHIHAEGNVLLGVVALPALGEPDPVEEIQAVEVHTLSSGEVG